MKKLTKKAREQKIFELLMLAASACRSEQYIMAKGAQIENPSYCFCKDELEAKRTAELKVMSDTMLEFYAGMEELNPQMRETERWALACKVMTAIGKHERNVASILAAALTPAA